LSFLLYASFRWRIPQFEHLATTCNIPYRTLPPFFISYPCWLTKAGRKGSLVFPGLLGYMDGWMDVREGGSGIVRHNLSDQLFTFLPFASSLLFFSLLLASSVCLVRNTSFLLSLLASLYPMYFAVLANKHASLCNTAHP
jgi:hypothetical protein